MKTYQQSLLTLLGIIGFLSIGYADDIAVPVAAASAPLAPAPAAVVDIPAIAAIAPAITPGAVAPVGPAVPAVITPVARPAPIVPSGEAVTTEHRSPDGSVITVTKYNGQLPSHLFQPQFPGFWGPYGLVHRPFYNFPV